MKSLQFVEIKIIMSAKVLKFNFLLLLPAEIIGIFLIKEDFFLILKYSRAINVEKY